MDKHCLPGKKHPCPDCHFCQWCSEDRCRLCRKTGPPKEHLSLKEQCTLYDRLNAEIFRNESDGEP